MPIIGPVGGQRAAGPGPLFSRGGPIDASLDLSFVAGTMPGAVTFTRGSTATYFDATGTLQTVSGNTPRFDNDPVTHAPLGLLIEESRTNLWLQSADASNAAWSYAGSGPPVAPVVTANQTTAPDGTLTAARIVYPAVSGANAYSIAYQSITTAAQQYTFSVWLKGSVGGEQIYLSTISALSGRVRATLTTQWQRFTVTPPTATAGSGVFEIGCDLRDGGSTSIPAATIYAWGAQVEAGAYPTSYIPTAAATVTRAIEVANISPLGAWFNASTGTLAFEFDAINSGSITGGFSSGAFADVFDLSGANVSANVAGTGTNATGTPVLFTGVVQKSAGRYATNNLAVCNNGGAVTVNAALGTSPYAWTSNLCLGNAPWATSNNGTTLDGHMRRVRYWPRVLSSTELQQVTT